VNADGPATILAVDDDAMNLDMITRALDGAGYRVVNARDGSRAVECAVRDRPDLILLDVRMQGESGFDVCRRVKEDGRLVRTPVIFMTAFSDEETKKLAFAAGAVDYVAKPLSHAELLARVSTHLEIARYRQDLEQEVEKRAAELQRRTEEQSLLLETMDAQVWYLTSDGLYGMVNRAHAAFLGVPQTELSGRNPEDFLPGELVAAYRRSTEAAVRSPGPHRIEEWARNAAGDHRLLAITKTPSFDSRGRLQYLVCVAVDITDEYELRERLRRELREKELLIREVHHRVKNNLSVVASLLQLQLSGVESGGDPAHALRASADRIYAMARIHQQVYEAGMLSELPMNDYVSSLVAQLRNLYDPDHRVAVHTDTDEVTMDVTLGIPCGIIINELVTNALKHAFPNRDGGRIRVVMTEEPGETCRLKVEDNGIGCDLTPREETGGTLGATLIRALCEQIGARLSIENRDGTRVTVEIPHRRDT
jgi:PAS domain S-box-containing protein